MRLDCGPCVVRSWRLDDAQDLPRHANDRDIWLDLRDRFPHPYTADDARAWVQFATTAGADTNFAIAVNDGPAAGGIGLTLRDDVERCAAEIGYWLGRAFWGRGIVTAALRCLTPWAMARHKLSRIYALPYSRNSASRRALEKAGYRLEGVMRRSAIKDGVVLDQAIYAITDRDLDVDFIDG